MTAQPAAADAARSPTHEALVLHVVPTPTPRGAQREARALADELDRPGRRRHRVLSLFEGTGDATEVPVDHSLHRPPGDRPAEGLEPGTVRALRRFLAEHRPVIAVAHGSDPLKYLVPAVAGRRTSLVHYAIGTYSGPTDGGARLAAWRFLTRRADAVAACGEDTLEECATVLRVPRERLSLVYNGRDPAVFRPQRAGDRRPDAPPLVLFVGALNSGKRPDRFIEVVAALRARELVFDAQIVGDGPLRASLEEPAAAAGAELMGPRGDVPELLRAADLLVFPSLPAGEGMPGVLIEAALSGVPVVATAVPGVRTIVEEGTTGLVVPVDDFDGLVDATESMIRDPDRRVAMAHAARRRAEEQFSMRAVGRRWLQVLDPLLPAEAAD